MNAWTRTVSLVPFLAALGAAAAAPEIIENKLP